MATMLKTIKKPIPNRTADEMFLRMVIECNCLTDDQIRMLSGIADKYFKQQQFAIAIERQETSEGPNVP